MLCLVFLICRFIDGDCHKRERIYLFTASVRPYGVFCTNYHSVILDARRHHASEQPPKAALSESQSERSEPKNLILHLLHKTKTLHNLFRDGKPISASVSDNIKSCGLPQLFFLHKYILLYFTAQLICCRTFCRSNSGIRR